MAIQGMVRASSLHSAFITKHVSKDSEALIFTPKVSTCLVLLFFEATPKWPKPFFKAFNVSSGIKIFPKIIFCYMSYVNNLIPFNYNTKLLSEKSKINEIKINLSLTLIMILITLKLITY